MTCFGTKWWRLTQCVWYCACHLLPSSQWLFSCHSCGPLSFNPEVWESVLLPPSMPPRVTTQTLILSHLLYTAVAGGHTLITHYWMAVHFRLWLGLLNTHLLSWHQGTILSLLLIGSSIALHSYVKKFRLQPTIQVFRHLTRALQPHPESCLFIFQSPVSKPVFLFESPWTIAPFPLGSVVSSAPSTLLFATGPSWPIYPSPSLG